MKMGRPEGWKAVAEDLLVLGLPRAHGGRSMMVLLGGNERPHEGFAALFEAAGLGRVDGFNQHQPACKTDDGGVADVGLFAAHGDALEPLELADGLFDTRPEFI